MVLCASLAVGVACSSSDDDDGAAGARPAPGRSAGGSGAEPAGRARRNRRDAGAPAASGDLLGAHLPDLPPGRPQPALRDRASGAHPGRPRPHEAEDALPGHRGPGPDRRGERPALDGLPSRLRAQPALLRLLRRQRRRPVRGRLPGIAARTPTAPSRDRGGGSSASPTRASTTRAASSSSGATASSTSASGTAAAEAIPTRTPRTPGGCSASCCRVEPRARGGGYDIPRDNPFVGRRGRAPRGLRVRAAQPLPLLIRPPHRRPLDRRRRAGRGGGDRLPARVAAGRGARAAASTSAGTCSRAGGGTSPAPRPATCRP